MVKFSLYNAFFTKMYKNKVSRRKEPGMIYWQNLRKMSRTRVVFKLWCFRYLKTIRTKWFYKYASSVLQEKYEIANEEDQRGYSA